MIKLLCTNYNKKAIIIHYYLSNAVLVCMAETLSLKLGIKEAARLLEGYGNFMFCHRSYLVNLRRISKVGKQDIIMDNGRAVPVSRRMYGAVNEGFMKL